MDAVTFLNDKMNVEAILKHYGFNVDKHNGDILRSRCLIHNGDSESAFAVNVETGLWYCHTNCGGGDIYTLVELKENVSFPQAVEWVANFLNVDISKLEINIRNSKNKKELQEFIKVMSRRKTQIKEHKIDAELKRISRFRDFKEETINHFGIMYAEKIRLQKKNGQSYTLSHRLVFPVIFNNIQVGSLIRRTKNSDIPKWSNQPSGIEFGEFLYNYDNVIGKKVVVVCEGLTDVWAYHEIGIPAVATFGAHISDSQYRLLMKLGADLCFSFDGDTAGEKATQRAITMFKNKAKTYVIKMNSGEDPCSITRGELKTRYDEKTRT